MPGKDRYHDKVVRAPRKQGWKVALEQYRLDFPERTLRIDIHATRSSDNQNNLVEVKGFEKMRSPVDYLQLSAYKINPIIIS